jgi:hypothetical protein
MEKKLFSLILIALLAGLGGGYGLGYVIYQPQIQNLQSDLKQLNDELETINSEITNLNSTINSEIANLNSTIVNLENKTWHFVTNFTLSSEERVSQLFFVQGETWRIKWKLAQAWGSGTHFIVWDENGNGIYYSEDVSIYTYMSPYRNATATHYMPYGKGTYYITVDYGAYTVDFTIESYH